MIFKVKRQSSMDWLQAVRISSIQKTQKVQLGPEKKPFLQLLILSVRQTMSYCPSFTTQFQRDSYPRQNNSQG